MVEEKTNPQLEALLKSILALYANATLEQLSDLLVRKNYNKGLEATEQSLKLKINVVPHKEAIEFLKEYTFENVKAMRDDISRRLRHEFVEALKNNEGGAKIKERVKKVLDVTDARAKAIARTESHRAYNEGSYNAAKQSGLTVEKVWYNPNPESAVCKALAGKKVALDEPFTYKGEEYQRPPAHVNCRSRILYEQVEEEE